MNNKKNEEKIKLNDKAIKQKAKEISKKPTSEQEKDLDSIFDNNFIEGFEVLKELVSIAKEDGKSISQANKELLDFYGHESDKLSEIIKDGNLSDDKILELNKMKKDIIEKAKYSSERTQNIENDSKKEIQKAVIDKTGTILMTGLIVVGLLKAIDIVVKAVKK